MHCLLLVIERTFYGQSSLIETQSLLESVSVWIYHLRYITRELSTFAYKGNKWMKLKFLFIELDRTPIKLSPLSLCSLYISLRFTKVRKSFIDVCEGSLNLYFHSSCRLPIYFWSQQFLCWWDICFLFRVFTESHQRRIYYVHLIKLTYSICTVSLRHAVLGHL